MDTSSSPSLPQYLTKGALYFGAVTILVYLTVAFGGGWMYGNLGRYGAYLTWTVLFIGLGGYALQPLIIGSLKGVKFYGIFAASFFMFAVGWCAAYFILHGKLGEWVGTFAGSFLMVAMLCVFFKNWNHFILSVILFFYFNAGGYFLGDFLNNTFDQPLAMTLWGVGHGSGLGLAMGSALYFVQSNKTQQQS